MPPRHEGTKKHKPNFQIDSFPNYHILTFPHQLITKSSNPPFSYHFLPLPPVSYRFLQTGFCAVVCLFCQQEIRIIARKKKKKKNPIVRVLQKAGKIIGAEKIFGKNCYQNHEIKMLPKCRKEKCYQNSRRKNVTKTPEEKMLPKCRKEKCYNMKTIKFKNKPSWLAELRKQHRLSQLQLAGYLGISRSLVARVENGSRSLPTYALERLVKLEKKQGS